MFESMFFPDSEHVGIRVMLPQKLGISTEWGGDGGGGEFNWEDNLPIPSEEYP